MRPVTATAQDEPPVSDTGGALSRALEQVMERYRGLLLRVCQRHGLSPADADDLMQEVRLRLWRHKGTVETLEDLGTSYVRRTAASAAVDLIRRRRAARTGVDVVGQVPVSAHGPDDPARTLETRELAEQVYAAVDRLLESRRVVVRMYLAGYERREIAAALGWDDVRVRNLLHRGLVDLRDLLRQEGIAPKGGGA